ncbi:Cof-type HAD-IIB family hydrolase [Vagococcus intermedius]|uniref:Cof-type HAD-IIB family hydrolase n=1 Tax=Vagococcus intermedius TaxID=2991418 RepID=A0AAF0CVR2_9ENTE|nr:Cof-type HAD-IIB family hydrolase [Vagococcus intermedius]WEG73915.1 Cof-type HAD-IIB family hydrolase [Vagococcus intermedius]WEG75997.1 Cof-type HAD-IIB family hydrolase [Vagococcus intermedius]
MTISAVFFDIDGTLIDSKGKVLDSTKHAVKAMKEAGIICGIATGRGPLAILPEIRALGFDVYVTYNGQFVYTEEEILRAESITDEMLRKLARVGEKQQRQLLFCSDNMVMGHWLLELGQKSWVQNLRRVLPKSWHLKRSNFEKKIHQQVRQPNLVPVHYTKLRILEKPIYQCLLASPESEQKKLIQLFPECTITRSNPYMVDIIAKGGSKWEGIQSAASYFSFDLSQTMAFGDSFNDQEMLESVGVGIAMGNAESLIKDIADEVTLDHNEDGILESLQKYGVLAKEKEQ